MNDNIIQKKITTFSSEVCKVDANQLNSLSEISDRIIEMMRKHEILNDPLISSLLFDGLRYRRKSIG